MNNNIISIVSQAFYGNRTGTEIKVENMDNFILGNLDNKTEAWQKIDRTIVKIPNLDNIVLVYNKYQEENRLKYKDKVMNEEGYEIKPVATIPEINMEIYSRCIACRINENEEFESLHDGDYEKIEKYLAE